MKSNTSPRTGITDIDRFGFWDYHNKNMFIPVSNYGHWRRIKRIHGLCIEDWLHNPYGYSIPIEIWEFIYKQKKVYPEYWATHWAGNIKNFTYWSNGEGYTYNYDDYRQQTIVFGLHFQLGGGWKFYLNSFDDGHEVYEVPADHYLKAKTFMRWFQQNYKLVNNTPIEDRNDGYVQGTLMEYFKFHGIDGYF